MQTERQIPFPISSGAILDIIRKELRSRSGGNRKCIMSVLKVFRNRASLSRDQRIEIRNTLVVIKGNFPHVIQSMNLRRVFNFTIKQLNERIGPEDEPRPPSRLVVEIRTLPG